MRKTLIQKILYDRGTARHSSQSLKIENNVKNSDSDVFCLKMAMKFEKNIQQILTRPYKYSIVSKKKVTIFMGFYKICENGCNIKEKKSFTQRLKITLQA